MNPSQIEELSVNFRKGSGLRKKLVRQHDVLLAQAGKERAAVGMRVCLALAVSATRFFAPSQPAVRPLCGVYG